MARLALAFALLTTVDSQGLDASLEVVNLQADDECVSDGEGGAHCAASALQLRTQKRYAEQTGAEMDAQGCHDIKPSDGGPCMRGINWAKTVGIVKHPEWYPGMTLSSPLSEWQFKAWNTSHPTCPRPCSAKEDLTWCGSGGAPALWKPKPLDKPVQVKILSYNLFWWNLFKIHGGRSAGELIKRSDSAGHFDVIGLQECEDTKAVFGPPGLEGVYASFHSSKNTCMAYRKSAWKLLAKGETEVADDMRTEYFGRRSAQWMRLQSVDSDATLFFVNHHGPLSVNSGGACGGLATAHNLLKVMAAHGQPGDILVLVGDFNANAASRTLQGLWPHLLQVYNGISFGGVDNIFSNVPRSSIVSTADLGSGGSDHHAVAATLSFGGKEAGDTLVKSDVPMEPALSVQNLEHAGGANACLIEPQTLYQYSDGWALHLHNIVDSRVCCTACMGNGNCQAWVWTEWSDAAKGPVCTLRHGKPHAILPKDGVVSGLPKGAAVKEAAAQAALY